MAFTRVRTFQRPASCLAAALAFVTLAACRDPGAPELTAARYRDIVFIGRTEVPGGMVGDPVLYAVRGDGQRLRRLTSRSGEELFPARSPDGARIAFSAGDGLWVMGGDGTGARRVGTVQCLYTFGHITWAPDGTQLAAECFGTTAIVSLADGATRWFPIHAPYPEWSRDGTRLLYGQLGGFAGSVFAARLDGTGAEQILTEAMDAAWSPDGRRLAFVAPTGERRRFALHLSAADGSDRRLVLDPAALDGTPEGPVWSPDGEWLAFHARSSLCTEAGTPPQRICIPHWSVYVVRTDGRGLRRLTPDNLQATRPTW